MRYTKHALAIGAALLIGVVLYRFGPEPKPESEGPPEVTLEAYENNQATPTTTSQVVVEGCPIEYPELLTQIAAFEAALHSRSPSTTNASLRAGLADLATPHLLASLTLSVEDQSNASRSLIGSTISATADPSGCEVSLVGTVDAPTAFVETEVTVRKFEGEAEVYSRSFMHQSWWIFDGSVWRADSMGSGSS